MRRKVFYLLVAVVLIFGGAFSSQAIADYLGGQYVDYTEEAFGHDAGIHRVLYFHASWCPSCIAGDRALQKLELPDNLTVFKVDYDSAKALKKKYGVVKQHTFVLVDEAGEKISLWSGPASSVLDKIK